MAGGADEPVERLIALMARLPGLGPRSARRAALQMIRRRALLLDPLVAALSEVAETVRECERCGNIATGPLCAVCADPRRATGEICVVESVADLWAMERAGAFRGHYHVLGGVLSALDGVGPEALRIPDLVARAKAEGAREVILALNATVDGQTTAHYIAGELAPLDLTVSTLAKGVPVGGELDYLDDGTIGAALLARRAM
ncbi:recombination mediator RecR [Amaricoccus solimangrovi]|uniref:Recombination protein RecR n=1 Tax=Amaricoccus solimangrovi TaxID=2589815 RepID=A0A501WCN3_9RHOB|nr:recombination mediator RecR [Amaricoccus solimangrovi]TPE46582.1 recombination protein RecR [Amaricoccus solimangrovi]